MDSFDGHTLTFNNFMIWLCCLKSAPYPEEDMEFTESEWSEAAEIHGVRSGQEGQRSWRRLPGDCGLRSVCCPSPATAEDLVTPPASVTTSAVKRSIGEVV